MKNKYITVYCGANLGTNPKHQEATKQLAQWIASQTQGLVYGGGKAGLMGLIADSVLAQGGKVIGVIPHFLQQRELMHTGLTELHLVETMTERKKIMFDRGDVFIALPGGLGTLEEISELISWARIGQNDKPCIFFNADNFYQNLQVFLQDMVNCGFLTEEDKNKFLFSDNLEEIQQFIQTYQPPQIRTYA